MAVQIGSLFTELRADTGSYISGMNRAASATEQSVSRIQRSAGVGERSVRSFTGSINSSNIRPYSLVAVSRAFDNAADRANLLRGSLLAVTGVFGGFTAALSTNLILRYADSFTKLNNLIRVVSSDQSDASINFNKVAAAADRSRSSLEATAILYARIARASPGAKNDEIVAYVETISKALQLGGATAQEARSAAIQFSQAIASNRLGGEELRAILETPLGGELARGLGVGIGQMRKMAEAGELTADKLFAALTKIRSSVDDQFKNSIVTLDQTLVILDNRFTTYIGTLNETYGATRRIGNGILSLANNLETVLPILSAVGTAMAGIFVSRIVAGGINGFVNNFRTKTKDLQDQANKFRDAIAEVQGKIAPLEASLNNAFIQKKRKGTDEYADTSAINEYQRAQTARTRADERGVQLQKELAQATQNSANVHASASKKTITAANNVIDIQDRMAAAVARNAQINRDLQAPQGRFEGARQYQQRIDGLMRESDRLVLKQIDDSKKLAAAQHALNQSMINDDRMLVAARTTALNEVTRLQNEVARNTVARISAATAVRTARDNVAVSGSENFRRITEGQTDQLRRMEQALAPIVRDHDNLTQSLNRSSGAMGVLRQAGAGIMGIFGGPWGAAFTAASVAISYLGLRALETSEQIERARGRTEKYLEELRGKTSSETFAAAVDAKLRAKQKEIEDQTLYLRSLVEGPLQQLARMQVGSSQFSQGIDTTEIRKTIEEFIRGEVKIGDFRDRLSEVGRAQPKLTPIIQELQRVAIEANGGVNFLRLLIEEADRLKRLLPQNSSIASVRELDQRNFDASKSDTENYIIESNKEIQILKRKAQGQEAYANALKKQQDLLKAGKNVPFEVILAQEVLEEKYRRQAQELKKTTRETENFREKLARLKEESEGAYLTDLDRAVARTARQMKVAAPEIEKYIEAAKAGNLTGVSKEILDIRQVKLMEMAGQASREIIQEYGNWSQIAPLLAERQMILNKAVADGVISVDQAQSAMARYLTSFGQFKWIEDATRAFSDNIADAIMGTNTWAQALENLRKAIVRIALEEVALRPLRDLLRNGLSSAAGVSGFSPISFGTSVVGLPGGGDAWNGLRMAGGGSVYGPGTGTSDSVPAWLSRGEFVVKERAARDNLPLLRAINSGIRIGRFAEGGLVMPTISGDSTLRGMAAMGGGGRWPVEVNIYGAPGGKAKASASQRPDGGLSLDIMLAEMVDDAMAKNIYSGRSKTSVALEKSYGLDPTRGLAS